MLGYGTCTFLVVRGSDNRRDTVEASRKTVGNSSGQDTVVIRRSVETLKEREDLGVQRLGRVQRCHRLYGNVAVALNKTIDQMLRCSEVSAGWVRECPRDQVVDLKGNGEWSVGRDGIKVPRRVEFSGRHVVDRGEITHGGRVARARLDLITIGNGLTNAVVDKVVRANKGIYLTSSLSLAIDILDDGRI